MRVRSLPYTASSRSSRNRSRRGAPPSHGAALRTLLGTLQGMSLEEIGQTGHGDNTAVSLLEVRSLPSTASSRSSRNRSRR